MNAHKKIIKDNVRTILKIIVREYNGIYSPVLYRILKRHPYFPSFLAFQYILKRLDKDSYAVHIGYEELLKIPLPCLVHVYTNVDLFLFVNKVTSEYVQIKNENGFIIVDENMQTNVEGLFCAGDILSKHVRQISTAVSDGTIAALSAKKFIEEKFE